MERAPDPYQVVFDLLSGFYKAKALAAAAALGIPDLLAEREQSTQDIAGALGLDAGALGRLMRALSSCEIFERTNAGLWRNSPTSALLRNDSPTQLRNFIALGAGEGPWRAWGELGHSLKTGQSAFEHANGVDYWGWLRSEQGRRARYTHSMDRLSLSFEEVVLEACDFTRYRSVLDVGGGTGGMMVRLLEATPSATAGVLDLAEVAAQAEARIAEAGLQGRMCFHAGSFLEAVPGGYDAYVLKWVVHNWPDEAVVTLLRNCREAMGADGELILIDGIVEEDSSEQEYVWEDLNRLVVQGGAERTAGAYRALLSAAGLEVSRGIMGPRRQIGFIARPTKTF